MFMPCYSLVSRFHPEVIISQCLVNRVPRPRTEQVAPDSKVHGAYMGPTCGRQDTGRPHVDRMILAIWGVNTKWITRYIAKGVLSTPSNNVGWWINLDQ